MGEGINITILDTFVHYRGFDYFPGLFLLLVLIREVDHPLFSDFANIFNHMPSGQLWGIALYLWSLLLYRQ